MTRKQIIENLRQLASDEFDAEEYVSLSDAELVNAVIDIAWYYKINS